MKKNVRSAPGERIHARAAGLRVDLVELVLHDRRLALRVELEPLDLLIDLGLLLLAVRCRRVDLRGLVLQPRDVVTVRLALLRVHQRPELGSQSLQLVRVVRGIPGIVDVAREVAGVLLGPHDVIDLVAQLRLLVAVVGVLVRIARTDRVGSLEHHVFEEVGLIPVMPGRSFTAADFGQPAGRNGVGLFMARQKAGTSFRCRA
jgi:hypothetical protein